MCMGPPRLFINEANAVRVYPHVYGATTSFIVVGRGSRGLSPCVWGHQKGRGIYIRISGSIPMCMGPPFSHRYTFSMHGVYPLVYGATSSALSFRSVAAGLSTCACADH